MCFQDFFLEFFISFHLQINLWTLHIEIISNTCWFKSLYANILFYFNRNYSTSFERCSSDSPASAGTGFFSNLVSNLKMLDTSKSSPRLVWEVARATSAAPTYFPPYNVFVDGGLLANNPTMDALSELSMLQHDSASASKDAAIWKQRSHIGLVLSVGCGQNPVQQLDPNDVAQMGRVGSPDDYLKLVLARDGVRALSELLVASACEADGHIVARASSWCSAIDASFVRLNPPVGECVPLNSTEPRTLIGLLCDTERFLASRRTLIDSLCALLLTEN